jgi:hypothetical protein
MTIVEGIMLAVIAWGVGGITGVLARARHERTRNAPLRAAQATDAEAKQARILAILPDHTLVSLATEEHVSGVDDNVEPPEFDER